MCYGVLIHYFLMLGLEQSFAGCYLSGEAAESSDFLLFHLA